MSTEPAAVTPRRTGTPIWVVFAILALALGSSGVVFYSVMRQQAMVNHQLNEQTIALAKRVKGLEGTQRFGQSSSELKSEVAALREALDASNAAVEELKTRLASVEKTAMAPAPVLEIQPAPAGATETLQQFLALKQAMESGQPYATQLAPLVNLPQLHTLLPDLQKSAEHGLTSEADLRAQLLPLLAPPAAPTDTKLDSINSHLQGMLHITRKPASDAYAALRAQLQNGATLDVLLRAIDGLSDDARSPLAEWYKAADARQSALAKLRAVETAILNPAS